MIEVVLQLSDEDVAIIEKELMCNSTTKNIKINIVEAWFRESPKFELDSMRGELY